MKTDFFSHEDDAGRALHEFDQHPDQHSFSAALAHQLLQTAQTAVTNLQAQDAMQAYWRYTNPNVVLYETVAYVWSRLSAEVNASVQYAFDDDRQAVTAAMLGGLNQANAIIRDGWFGFAPEVYALSRLMCYPRELSLATPRFFSVLALSEGRDFPLFPGELPDTPSDMAAGIAWADTIDTACFNNLIASCHHTTAALVARLLNEHTD